MEFGNAALSGGVAAYRKRVTAGIRPSRGSKGEERRATPLKQAMAAAVAFTRRQMNASVAAGGREEGLGTSPTIKESMRTEAAGSPCAADR